MNEQMKLLKILYENPDIEAARLARRSGCSWIQMYHLAELNLIDLGMNRMRAREVHPEITAKGIALITLANTMETDEEAGAVDQPAEPRISPSEAVFGFAGWLSGRKQRVTVSACDDAGTIAVLATRFCEKNGLPDITSDYPQNLKFPEE